MSHLTLSEKSLFLMIHFASLSHSSTDLRAALSASGLGRNNCNLPAIDRYAILSHLIFAELQVLEHLCTTP